MFLPGYLCDNSSGCWDWSSGLCLHCSDAGVGPGTLCRLLKRGCRLCVWGSILELRASWTADVNSVLPGCLWIIELLPWVPKQSQDSQSCFPAAAVSDSSNRHGVIVFPRWGERLCILSVKLAVEMCVGAN